MNRAPVAPLRPEIDRHVADLVAAVRIRSRSPHEPVVLELLPRELEVVGRGTEAVVVRHPLLPHRVFKVYAPQTIAHLDDEYRSYRALAGSRYFPACLGRGEFYLLLSYEPGPTLCQCLEQGIAVPEQVLVDVEDARRQARALGLHPKDSHLRNVVLQNGRAKILDLSKFAQPGDDDPAWDHVVAGYRRFYPLIRGRRIPGWVIERARQMYRSPTG